MCNFDSGTKSVWPILAAIGDHILLHLWQEVAVGRNGKGTEQGVDTVMLRALKRLGRKTSRLGQTIWGRAICHCTWTIPSRGTGG